MLWFGERERERDRGFDPMLAHPVLIKPWNLCAVVIRYTLPVASSLRLYLCYGMENHSHLFTPLLPALAPASRCNYLAFRGRFGAGRKRRRVKGESRGS